MRVYIKMKHGDRFVHKANGYHVTYKAISMGGTTCVTYCGFYKNYIKATLVGGTKNSVLTSVSGVVKIL